MPGAIDATLSGPAGFLRAIEAKAARLGVDRAKLLQRAGVTQAQFDALDAALSSANAETWRRLQNAVRSQAALYEQTATVREGPGGTMTAASYGQHHQSHFGDLG